MSRPLARRSVRIASALALLCGVVPVSRLAAQPEPAPERPLEAPTAPPQDAPTGEPAAPPTAPPAGAPGEVPVDAPADVPADEPVDAPVDPHLEGRANDSLEELLGLELVDTIGDTDAASRTRESVLSAPAAITTLDADGVRASGARTLPDLLRFVPGVQVAETAPGSFLVSLRGMNGIVGNNVVVTIEGVPINSPLDGSVEWAAIPFDVRDVERIEVVRGPVSAIYGANAYTGVINIVTHRGYGRLPVWSARTTGTMDDRFRGAGQGSFRWARSDEHREFAVLGVAGYDDVFSRASSGSNPALASTGMLGRVAFTLPRGRLEAQAGYTAMRRSSLEHLALARVPEWRDVTTARLQFTSDDLPSVLGNLAVWARVLDHRVPTTADAATGFSYRGTNAFRSNAGFDLPLALHRTLRVTVGGEVDLDAVRAPYVVGGADGLARFGYGGYVQAQYDPHERVTLSGSVRVDRPTVDPTPLLSYRAAAVYHTDRLAIRASAASSFRAPTYVERLGRFVDPAQGIIILEGSPLLAPRNTSFEAGATYSPRVDVRMSASVYASRLTRLVLEDFYTIPRKTFVSDGRERWLGGAELELELDLLDSLHVVAAASLIRYFSDFPGDPPTVAVPKQNSDYTASVRMRGSLRGDRLRYGVGTSFASRRAFFGAVGVPWVFERATFDPIVLVDATFEHVLPTRVPFWVFARAQVNPLGRTQQSFLPGASLVGSAFTVGLELRRD